MKTYYPRIFCHIAREAPVAVVLRRGPSKWTCMLRWNLDDDTIESGQWFHGRVYERRCDLSPDGKYFVYFAMNGKWSSESKGSWTAISKPPFFTALAMWPKGDCWDGGGFFTDNRHLFLCQQTKELLVNVNEEFKRHFQLLKHAPDGYSFHGECLSHYFPLMHRDGWTLSEREQDKWIWARPSPKFSGLALLRVVFASTEKRIRKGRGVYFDEYQISEVSKTSPRLLDDVDWAEWDRRGRLLFSRHGQLFARSFKDLEHYDDKLIADLSKMTPTQVSPAVSATHW